VERAKAGLPRCCSTGSTADAGQIADISALHGRFSVSNWSDEHAGIVELLHEG
jgi:hypothetical protein